MIELITGLPGNAKTLYTIGQVMRRAESEGRPVYYAGIKGLNLDWTEIDPLKWMDCPPGSIIVIDECQKVFRNRSLGTQPGPHVTGLEEHRHQGLDFYLITQHPSLIDPAVRRLSGVHKHLIRIFGMEVSMVHKWSAVVDTPDKAHCRKDSEKERWAFDKGLYGVYHSAEVHTMKRSIPLRLKLLVLVPLLLIGAIWGVWYLFIGKHSAKPAVAEGRAAEARQSRPVPSTWSSERGRESVGDKRPSDDPVADAKRFVFENTPRVVGLPQTAPKYDELTKPVRVPVPAACIEFRGRCKCMTQQATPMDVKESMCREFARNGFFQDFDADRDRKDAEKTAMGSRVLDRREVATRDDARSMGPQVAVFGNPAGDVPKLPVVSTTAAKSTSPGENPGMPNDGPPPPNAGRAKPMAN